MMLEFQRTVLSIPALLQAADYSQLLLPSLSSRLLSAPKEDLWLTLEARRQGELVGLAVIEILPHDYMYHRLAQLRSLVITPTARGQGIGRQLFAFMEHTLVRQESIDAIAVEYDKTSPYARAIEKIMASQGWSPSEPFLTRYHFNAYHFNPPWLHHPFHLPSSLAIFSWKDLRPKEKELIEFMASQAMFLSSVSPFRDQDTIDLETSVGLRDKNQVVGWNITHRPDPETICYSALYVDNSLHYKGYGIQLLIESIRRHKQLPIPNALFEINLSEINPSWQRFINRRLQPLASRIEKIQLALRIFT